MIKKTNNNSNIRTFHKKSRVNVGIVIFSIILIYLIVMIFTYLTKKHVTEYEVRTGSILKDNSYTGFVLREETIVNAAAAGYVNYYVDEGSKTAVGNNIYTLSDDKIDLSSGDSTQEVGLTADETANILMNVQSFTENYTRNRFFDTYSLKTTVESVLQSNTGQGKLARLDALISSGTVPGLSLFQSPDDGIVIFSKDGFEGVTKETITTEQLSKKDYLKEEFVNNQRVETGEPVFKLITSEYWSVVIQVSEEVASQLTESERKSIQVKFQQDNQTIRAGYTVEEKDGSYMVFLNFDNSMVRYASDRYVDIELILENQTGLKIPKTAAIEKPFYVVPLDYITQSGKSKENGVLVMRTSKKGNETTEFAAAEVYYENEDTGMAYLDMEHFSQGDTLVQPATQQNYTIGATDSLMGVYNINKGYAIFKQINILCESDEYYIISSGSDYGLANYDHIALNGDSMKENAVVFE